MNIESHIIEALDIVTTWDIPEEDLADAIADQAMLMAGINTDELWERPSDTH